MLIGIELYFFWISKLVLHEHLSLILINADTRFLPEVNILCFIYSLCVSVNECIGIYVSSSPLLYTLLLFSVFRLPSLLVPSSPILFCLLSYTSSSSCCYYTTSTANNIYLFSFAVICLTITYRIYQWEFLTTLTNFRFCKYAQQISSTEKYCWFSEISISCLQERDMI